jgi:ribokinase
MSDRDILVIGSLNTDLVAMVDRFPGPGETLIGNDFKTTCGGKGANQAFAAGALGGNVAMLGQVGKDDFGTAQLRNLSSQGVLTDYILRDSRQPTGRAFIGVDASGENRIIVVPGANGSFTSKKLQTQAVAIESAKLLLLQLEIPHNTVAEAIRLGNKAGATLILDPAPAAPLPDEWLISIDYLTPNLSELGLLSGDLIDNHTSTKSITTSARKLCDRGSRCVIVKLGSRGALQVTATESTHYPAAAVKAIDTTAAGDCFNAAFAVELQNGKSENEAIRFAHTAATLSVTKQGAQSSMPTRQEVESSIPEY